MDLRIFCLHPSRFSGLLAVLLSFSLLEVSALAQPRLEGSLSETAYTSLSGRLNCAMEGVPMGSTYFSIDDSATPEFEGVTFGYDDGNSYLTWIVRVQKDGRKDVSPATSDAFPVTAETYISYFYSELPYAISELSQEVLEEAGGSTGLLKVQFDGSRQIHGYWVRPLGDWFQSVQLLPALSPTPAGILSEKEVSLGLQKMVEQCGFTSGK
jgi:hypothetical protein